jgi:peptide methionine sulfoxide reductase msrA/msrB
MLRTCCALAVTALALACQNERPAPRATPALQSSSPVVPHTRSVAILAGGCFWGMEEILREIPGILETEVGYAGGVSKDPDYETVKTGATGHAEAVRVVFDPNRISYAELLEKWFFRMHDPTTKNRQGNDVGTQYRSAIYYTSDEQRKVAEAVKTNVNESGKWSAPLVNEIEIVGPITPAEA